MALDLPMTRAIISAAEFFAMVFCGLMASALIFVPLIIHTAWCVREMAETGSAMELALLIVGIVLPPIGWTHGIFLWHGDAWI